MVTEVNYARPISAFGTFHNVLFFCGRLPPLRRSISDGLINGRPFFQFFIQFAIPALRCIASRLRFLGQLRVVGCLSWIEKAR